MDVVRRPRRDIAWWVTLGREGSDERTRSRGRPRSGGSAAASGTYRLSHLRALEAQAIHIFREVAAEFERPVLLFSGGKDSIVMLHLATKAFWPGPMPFPVLHVDTGRNFAEVLEFRDRHVADLGVKLLVASVQEDIDAGRTTEATGTQATRNRLQTPTLLRAIADGQVRRRLRRGPPRRGEGAGQGTDLQLPRRVRPVGPQETAAGTVEPLQRATPCGRAHPGLPPLELDRARRVAVHRRRERSRSRPSTSPTAARCSSVTAC